MTTASHSNLHFAKCFVGIFVSYWVFGIVQEWITRHSYGPNKERYTFTYCLVFVQCLANTIVAKLIIASHSAEKKKKTADTTKVWMFPLCALTYMCAMLASNEALQHVSYPTQVIGKSIKPVPVMILGVLLAGKRYRSIKYAAILMIVTGIVLFMKKDHVAKESNNDKPLIGFGEILLLLSLAADGLTGAVQDKMNSQHRTDPHQMMYNMNFWSTLYLAVAILGSGEIVEFLVFVSKYQSVLGYMALLSVCGSVGQHFIFSTITAFGPLRCSLVTTTRKFFTVLGSVFLFNNPISSKQWIGVALVFIGLAIDSKYGKEIKKSETTEKVIHQKKHVNNKQY